jgi:hypothetical protein
VAALCGILVVIIILNIAHAVSAIYDLQRFRYGRFGYRHLAGIRDILSASALLDALTSSVSPGGNKVDGVKAVDWACFAAPCLRGGFRAAQKAVDSGFTYAPGTLVTRVQERRHE